MQVHPSPHMGSMPPAFPLYTSPAHMQAQLLIRKANAPDSQAKTVPVQRFPCVMASDPQTPHLQVRLPPSFPGALMLVQQVDKLLLRTGPNTQVQINESFPVRADDWAQLRPGDCLSCGAWLLQVHFTLAPHFPGGSPVSQPAAASTQVVVESENEPTPVVATPPSPAKVTVSPGEVIPPAKEEHPIFGHGDGLDLDDMMNTDPLLSSVEPELTEELSRLALPSPPPSPTPAPKKKGKARRRSQSVPQGTVRVYLHLTYPSSPDQKTGKRTNEEEYLPLPTSFRVPSPPSPGPASPSESENDSSQANVKVAKPAPKKKPATPKRQPKKAAKPATPTQPKKRPGRPPARSVVPTAARPATPTKRKGGRPPAATTKPRRATTVSAGAASPGRSLPSRASRGRMLSDEEKSRLSRESNAELRRMIGEKRH